MTNNPKIFTVFLALFFSGLKFREKNVFISFLRLYFQIKRQRKISANAKKLKYAVFSPSFLVFKAFTP